VTPTTPRRRVALVLSAGGWRGSHLSLSGIARGLGERGHDVIVLSGKDEPTARFREFGIAATQLDLAHTQWATARALRAALGRHRIDLVVTDQPRDLRLAALAVLGTDIRLVHRFNLGRFEPPQDLGTRLAFRRASGTIFLTAPDAQRVIASAPYFGTKPHWIIGSPVDPAVFHPDAGAAEAFRKRLQLGAGPFLLAAGALVPHKRYDVLVDAMALLGGDAPPLVVCGEGRLQGAIAEQAAARGVTVRFAGLLAPEEMRGAFSAATVVVHASPRETFGRTVAEAMACGAAIVAVGAGSLNEVLGDAGVLVPAAEAEAFATAAARLLGAPALRAELGARASARCAERYSLAATLDAYEALFADPRLGLPVP
jgi:glycosyltransferase involved in cell wall biosynthesis